MPMSPSSAAGNVGSHDLLSVRTDHRGGVAVVRVEGEVDLATVPAVASALEQALSGGSDAVVVDMSAVGFLCSKGVSLLIDAEERAERNGVRLCLVTTQRAVLRPIQVLGLHDRFLIRASVAHVLEELAGE